MMLFTTVKEAKTFWAEFNVFQQAGEHSSNIRWYAYNWPTNTLVMAFKNEEEDVSFFLEVYIYKDFSRFDLRDFIKCAMLESSWGKAYNRIVKHRLYEKAAPPQIDWMNWFEENSCDGITSHGMPVNNNKLLNWLCASNHIPAKKFKIGELTFCIGSYSF